MSTLRPTATNIVHAVNFVFLSNHPIRMRKGMAPRNEGRAAIRIFVGPNRSTKPLVSILTTVNILIPWSSELLDAKLKDEGFLRLFYVLKANTFGMNMRMRILAHTTK